MEQRLHAVEWRFRVNLVNRWFIICGERSTLIIIYLYTKMFDFEWCQLAPPLMIILAHGLLTAHLY